MPRLLAQLGEILTRRQQCGLAALVGMSAIASLADSLGIMLVFLLVTLISDSRSVVEPGWLAWLHHTSGVTDRRQFALLFGVSAFVLFMLKNAYAALLYYLQCEFCQRGAADFSTRLYRGYVQAPFATHARRHSADLVRNTRELGNHVYREALMALLAIGVEVMVLAGITMVLLALQPLATMVAGTIVVVAFLI
jgi:HlyD family secretion protein